MSVYSDHVDEAGNVRPELVEAVLRAMQERGVWPKTVFTYAHQPPGGAFADFINDVDAQYRAYDAVREPDLTRARALKAFADDERGNPNERANARQALDKLLAKLGVGEAAL